MVLAVLLLPAVEQVADWGEYLHQRLTSRQKVISVRAHRLENYLMAQIDGSQFFIPASLSLFLDSLFPGVGFCVLLT